jgi:hypothetical protein
MEEVWDASPAEKFISELRRSRARHFMRNRDFMKSLRHNYEAAKDMQRSFGEIWETYGTNVFQLIAEAHGESWDADLEESSARSPRLQDEEKHAPAREPKKTQLVEQRETDNDDVVRTCEESARQRQHQLQGVPQASECVLEEVFFQECSPKSSPKEEAQGQEEKEKMRRMRGGAFYRRAGGT